MKLVTLKNDFPVFNPEVRLIKDFNALLTRDKGSKGDHDGRNKLMSTKELAFVHFISYPNSEFVTGYPEENRVNAIKKHLGLPESWKPDSLVELACITYKELIFTPSSDSLVEARESLFSANKLIKMMRKRLESKLQQLDAQLTGVSEEEAEKQIQEDLDRTIKDFEKIIDISKKMPDTLDTIHKLEERVKKEMQAEQKGRGALEVNEFEM